MANSELDDIWAGGSIKKSDKYKDVHFDYDPNIARMVQSYVCDEGISYILKFIGFGILLIGGIYLSVIGPSLWHKKLVVCSGGTCTEYMEWKVLGENQQTGILEVWAGGRLQRLSNGTWHYE